MKIIICLCMYLLSFALHADPAPFGLMINKTSVDDLKNKYPVKSLGINKNNGLEAFAIDTKKIDFENLTSAKAAFSEDGILKIVHVTIPKTKFEDIFNNLSNKYTIVYKNIPRDGNKEAKFEQDNTYIILLVSETSLDMDFLYINKKLLDDTLLVKPKENSAVKKNKEISQL